MKTWTYDEITKATEEWITSHMDLARVSGSWDEAQQHVDFAYGMWMLWCGLTTRRGQKTKDRKRLYSLTKDEKLNRLPE
jgi:hypothetical protein